MEKQFVQCLLNKYLDGGDCLKTVVWLPEKFVRNRKPLKLQSDDGSWSEGWFVQERYSMRSESHVLAHERDFAKQRNASDI
jgi:hypothetical protein